MYKQQINKFWTTWEKYYDLLEASESVIVEKVSYTRFLLVELLYLELHNFLLLYDVIRNSLELSLQQRFILLQLDGSIFGFVFVFFEKPTLKRDSLLSIGLYLSIYLLNLSNWVYI